MMCSTGAGHQGIHQQPMWNSPAAMATRGHAMEWSPCGTNGGPAFTAFPTKAATAVRRYGERPCSKLTVPPLGADVGGVPAHLSPSPDKRDYGKRCGVEYESCGVLVARRCHLPEPEVSDGPASVPLPKNTSRNIWQKTAKEQEVAHARGMAIRPETAGEGRGG